MVFKKRTAEHIRFAQGNSTSRRTVADGFGGKISVRFLGPMDGSGLLKKGEDCKLPQEKIDRVNNLFTRQNNVLTLPPLEYFNEIVKLLLGEVEKNADWKYSPAKTPVFKENCSPPDIGAKFTFARQHDPANPLLVVELRLLAGRPLDASGTTMRFIARLPKVIDGRKGIEVILRPLDGTVMNDAQAIGDILYAMLFISYAPRIEETFRIGLN